MDLIIALLCILAGLGCVFVKIPQSKINLKDFLEKKLGRYTILQWAGFGFVLLASLAFRRLYWGLQTGDWVECLRPWTEIIRERGGFASLSGTVTNYTVPYTFFLTILSYLPEAIWKDCIKLLSCVFDYLAAFGMVRLVYERQENIQIEKKILLGAAVLFSPLVVLDGSAWGQCDMLYVTFVIFSLIYLIKYNEVPGETGKTDFGDDDIAMLFLGIAFSLKLQTVFVLPVFLLVSIGGRLRLRKYLWIPVMYLLTSLPALIMGRSLKAVLKIYFTQMGEYSMLTMNYPNFFTFAPEDKDIGTFGILLCMGIFFLVFYTLAARKAELTRELLIKAAIFSVLNATYFLPHMHERYSLIAEVLMLGWLCYDFKKLYLVVITYAATMLTYIKYIFNAGELALPEELLSVVRLMVLAAVAYDLLSPRDGQKQQTALTETE